MRSHVWMTIGLAAGLVLGLAAATTQHPTLITVATGLRPLGTLFLNLLSMVVIPLVVTALFAGVAGLGSVRRVGRLGVRTVGFFWATTLAAILIGFVVAALFLPLAGVTPDQQAALRQAALADSGVMRHAAEQIPTGARFLVELIPANPVRAVVAGLAVFIAGVLLPAVILVVRVKATRFLKASWPSMAMAFSTTSSLATLPTMLAAAEQDLKISRTVASFALPLGASINRSGSALFQAVAILFAARLYGVALGVPEMFQAGAAVFLASLTVASVPSASIVSLAPAFTATGLPLAGLTLLIGLDRVPDMFRTM